MCTLDFKNSLSTKKNNPITEKPVHTLSLFEWGFIYQLVNTIETIDVLLNKI